MTNDEIEKLLKGDEDDDYDDEDEEFNFTDYDDDDNEFEDLDIEQIGVNQKKMRTLINIVMTTKRQTKNFTENK